MSEREIMDAKNGIVARESYGFRDEVVKNVVDKFVERSNVGYQKYGQTLHSERTSKVKEFMQSTWKGFERQQLTSMLQTEDTTYPVDKLKHIAKVVSTVPENVQFVRKAERILQGRSKMVFDTNTLDWGMAENLAYGSLLEEGFNVRISGQDVERGTFSHRHAILRDEISEERINLLAKVHF